MLTHLSPTHSHFQAVFPPIVEMRAEEAYTRSRGAAFIRHPTLISHDRQRGASSKILVSPRAGSSFKASASQRRGGHDAAEEAGGSLAGGGGGWNTGFVDEEAAAKSNFIGWMDNVDWREAGAPEDAGTIPFSKGEDTGRKTCR